jgi:hypothetical protein
MSIQLDTEILSAALATISKVAAGSSVAHFNLMSKDILQISASNKGTGVALYIPCSAKVKEAEFSLEHAKLQAALSGKKSVEIEVGAGSIKLKSTRQAAELVTVTADKEKILPKGLKEGEAKGTLKIPGELISFIRENISEIELKPILETYSYMPIAVRCSDKGTIIVCYDNWHMAFATTKKITGKVEFSLPASALSLLAKEFSGRTYKMSITDSTLYAYNDSFEVKLPLPQQDSQNIIPAENAFELAMGLRKTEGVKVELAVEDMASLSTNMEAVFKKGEHVEFKIADDVCNIVLKSTFGRIASKVRCRAKKKITFRAQFGFMRDILSKMPAKTLELTIVPGRMLFFTKGHRTFMLSLINNEKTE